MTEFFANNGCEHPKEELRKRILSDKREVLVRQCVTCGQITKQLKQAGVNMLLLPPYDPDLQSKWSAERSRERQEAWRKEQEEKSSQFWVSYSAYLRSEHWHVLRRIVLARDPLCQFCFKNSSVQVHHLSYEGFKKYGISFACECIGICLECHKKLHPGMDA